MELSLTDIFTIFGLVATGFIATNLDNLLIMVVLLGSNKERRYAVMFGFVCASLAIITLSAIGVALGRLLDVELIGFLGLIPITLGLHTLYRRWRGESAAGEGVVAAPRSGRRQVWFTTFVLMLSNGGDSIAVFLPLLAESNPATLLVIFPAYLVMAMSGAMAASLITGRRGLAQRIERHGELIVPWVMIGMGTYILFNTATDSVS